MGQSPCLGIKTRKIKAPARRLANRSAALGQTINLVSGVAIDLKPSNWTVFG
jgi:hypothetical protein